MRSFTKIDQTREELFQFSQLSCRDVSKDGELILLISTKQEGSTHTFFSSLTLFNPHKTGRRETRAFSSFLVTINISPQKENSLIKHLHFLLLLGLSFTEQQLFYLGRSGK
jgi:hypothetical protein